MSCFSDLLLKRGCDGSAAGFCRHSSVGHCVGHCVGHRVGRPVAVVPDPARLCENCSHLHLRTSGQQRNLPVEHVQRSCWLALPSPTSEK